MLFKILFVTCFLNGTDCRVEELRAKFDHSHACMMTWQVAVASEWQQYNLNRKVTEFRRCEEVVAGAGRA